MNRAPPPPSMSQLAHRATGIARQCCAQRPLTSSLLSFGPKFIRYTSSTAPVARERAPLPSEADIYNPLVNILEDDSLPIRAVKVTSTGINLADGLVVPPTCIFHDGKVFVWTPPPVDPMSAMPNGKGWEAWNNDVWSLFELTSPRPEILIFGTGNTVLPVPPAIRTYLNSLGIQLDVQNTVRLHFTIY